MKNKIGVELEASSLLANFQSVGRHYAYGGGDADNYQLYPDVNPAS